MVHLVSNNTKCLYPVILQCPLTKNVCIKIFRVSTQPFCSLQNVTNIPNTANPHSGRFTHYIWSTPIKVHHKMHISSRLYPLKVEILIKWRSSIKTQLTFLIASIFHDYHVVRLTAFLYSWGNNQMVIEVT